MLYNTNAHSMTLTHVPSVAERPKTRAINRGRRHPLYHLHSRTVASKKKSAAKMQGFRYLSIMFRTFPQHAKTAGKRAQSNRGAGVTLPLCSPKARTDPRTQPDALLLHRRCWMPGTGTVVRPAQPQPRPPFVSTNHRRQARRGTHHVPAE
jgi:hypothetical protein